MSRRTMEEQSAIRESYAQGFAIGQSLYEATQPEGRIRLEGTIAEMLIANADSGLIGSQLQGTLHAVSDRPLCEIRKEIGANLV